MQRRASKGALAVLALAAAAGCGLHRPASHAGGVAPPLAEVGRLEIAGAVRCAATLFAASFAVTAGHCVGPDLTLVSPASAFLAFERGGAVERFPVDGAAVFGTWHPDGPGGLNADVAVVHLARPVPNDLARPRPLARAPLAAGDLVTFVGLSAVRRGEPPRLTTWRFSPSVLDRVMHPGDSGGPLLEGEPGALGAIAAVGSGYASTPCAASAPDAMMFGDVARAAPSIDRAIATWAPGR